ncbi:hypothetical protein [Thalassospira lucentensis]|uniref:hypothetical protein n=1 Tax=Thalassospira lucentensis TaxID=168935 RepID=UPI003D2CD351
MEFYELDRFIVSMKKIESFLSELAAREIELKYSGAIGMRGWESYENIKENLQEFENKLFAVIRLSKFVDQTIHDRINSVISESDISRGISKISVGLRVMDMKNQRKLAVRRFAFSFFDVCMDALSYVIPNMLFKKGGFIFNEEDVSLSSVLVGMHRLIAAVSELDDLYLKKRFGSNESFKPQNINIENVLNNIDGSIIIVSEDYRINKDIRDRVVSYLEDAKVELSSDSPSWKKIIGTLVIVSTILSGVAAAPEAFDNIQNAIFEILGKSINGQSPNLAPEHNPIPRITKT